MKFVLIPALALFAVTGRGDELTNLFGYHPGMVVPSDLRSRIVTAPGIEKIEITSTNSFCGLSNVTLYLERSGDRRIKSLSTHVWMTDTNALIAVRSNVIAAIGSHGVTNKEGYSFFQRGVCRIALFPVDPSPNGSNRLTISLTGPPSIAKNDLRNTRPDDSRPNEIVGAFGQRLGSRVVEVQGFGFWATNKSEITYGYQTNNSTFETNVIVMARIDPATGLIVEIWGGQDYAFQERADVIYGRVRGLIESKHGKLSRHPDWPMSCTLNQKGNNFAIWDVKQRTNGTWGVRVNYRDSAANALEREEDF